MASHRVVSAARWLALAVPLVDVVLVSTGLLSLRTGIVVALVLEALLAVVLVVEAAAVHVLLPWETARWVLLAVSLYALGWVLGWGLSLFQHPHLLREDELVLRSGHLRAVVVPLGGLVAVRRSVESQHGKVLLRDGSRLVLSVMGDTDVELRFDPPADVAGQDEPVARVAFWVDDPRAVVRLLRERAVSATG